MRMADRSTASMVAMHCPYCAFQSATRYLDAKGNNGGQLVVVDLRVSATAQE